MDNILNDIKKMLGIEPEYDQFDTDIIIFINSAITTLKQIGLSTPKNFTIKTKLETWSEMLLDEDDLDNVKPFIYFKTRLGFDPPSNAFVVDAMEREIRELTFRIQIEADKTDRLNNPLLGGE